MLFLFLFWFWLFNCGALGDCQSNFTASFAVWSNKVCQIGFSFLFLSFFHFPLFKSGKLLVTSYNWFVAFRCFRFSTVRYSFRNNYTKADFSTVGRHRFWLFIILFFLPLSEVCSVDCGTHGVCMGGACRCEEGWTGAGCDQRVCNPLCIKHGTCKDGKCQCHQGWNGEHCTIGERYECAREGMCVVHVCDSTSWSLHMCGHLANY